MLDRIDIQIIKLLRNNARISNKDLAEKIGVAPSTALERVRKLREDRLIVGFYAELDPKQLGIHLQAMVAIRIAKHSQQLLSAFHAHLKTLNEVLSFYHVAGADDYLIHVGVRDSEHLREFVLNALTSRPEVAHIETHLIFEFQRNADTPIYIATDD